MPGSMLRAAALAAMTAATMAVAPTAFAQQAAPAAQEVAYLLDTVAKAPCQFNRNGSWYDGAAARAHLQKKYDYLAKRKLALTAEAFIERGATASSVSGKPYQIRCAGAAPVASAAWLSEQLARYRKEHK
jgi:hypothetical protein